MNWSEKVFAYCERGSDPAFWAEPLNALSNSALLIAALVALAKWRWSGRDPAALSLIAIVCMSGIGSFLFHTVATVWARVADVAPISVFMVGYLVFALRRFLALDWTWVAAGVGLFATAGVASGSVTCSGAPCLNGSAGYLPALFAMILIAIALRHRNHPAARALIIAAGVFAVSLAFRTIDQIACPIALIQPNWRVGTHALWHVLISVVLYILLRAAIRCGDGIRKFDKVISN